MSAPFMIYLFVVEAEARSKQLSLICAVKDVLSSMVYFYSGVIHLLLLEPLPSISVID